MDNGLPIYTDTGSDTDISPHISPKTEVFAKEAICKGL